MLPHEFVNISTFVVTRTAHKEVIGVPNQPRKPAEDCGIEGGKIKIREHPGQDATLRHAFYPTFRRELSLLSFGGPVLFDLFGRNTTRLEKPPDQCAGTLINVESSNDFEQHFVIDRIEEFF